MRPKRVVEDAPRYVGPVFMVQQEAPGRGTTGRRVAAVAVPVALIAAVAATSALFLSGVVRIGGPSATAVTTASRVSASARPLNARSRFDADDEAIYCCATVRAFADTTLEARWFQAGVPVGTFKSTFARMAGPPPVKFLAARGNVAFRLERPPGGWATGPYSVKVFVDGVEARERSFMISEEAPEGMTGARYSDPAAGFSIVVPEGWLAADGASLGGAPAGFLAPHGGGAYPPRFAVSLTDFESAEPGYLNSVVGQAGGTATEQFSSYSINEMVGARRVFEWDYASGSGQNRLRTIQVVMQSGDKVFSIDCHSLASEFASNEPILNAIVNSFR